ncbi:MAG: GlxA family transcriptional regulator [Pseudomonadota bacterium]
MTKSPQNPPNQNGPIPVEIVVFDNGNLLDIAGPLQVLTSCNELLEHRGAEPAYQSSVISATPGLVRTSSGLEVAAGALPDADTPLDTLVVCGGHGVHRAIENSTLVEWVSARASTARRVASVCTGAFLLAAAGLLEGRRAVTHWAHCDELAAAHPEVSVEADPIFIEDGKVWTSAGVTSGIDLMLALVERDLGRSLALAVARQIVVYLKRPGGQAQFSAELELQDRTDRFDRLHTWAKDNLDGDLSVANLASFSGLSERSFNRRYKEATGVTPARAVERMRLEAAQRYLCGSDFSVKEIARRCGFGTEETMRRSFIRQVGTAPSEFRRRFGA